MIQDSCGHRSRNITCVRPPSTRHGHHGQRPSSRFSFECLGPGALVLPSRPSPRTSPPPPPWAVNGRPRSRARTLRSPVCTPRARATVPKVYRYSPCLEEHLYVPSHHLCSPPLVVEDAVCVRVQLRVAGLHPGLRGLASTLNVTGFRAYPPS